MSKALAAEKKALRAQLAAMRDTLAARPDAKTLSQAACARVSGFLHARFGESITKVILAAYMPMRGEIDPIPAMVAHPGPVCVPVIAGRGLPLGFHRWRPDAPMVEGAFRARIPQSVDPLRPHVLLVPLLGYDCRGFRLGYGGGYYDRTLALLRADPPVLAIGFAFDAQEVDRVPIDTFDQRLDAIITPSKMMLFDDKDR